MIKCHSQTLSPSPFATCVDLCIETEGLYDREGSLDRRLFQSLILFRCRNVRTTPLKMGYHAGENGFREFYFDYMVTTSAKLAIKGITEVHWLLDR